MKVIELIDKLDALPENASVYFMVDGYAEDEHRTIETIVVDEDGDVVMEGGEA